MLKSFDSDRVPQGPYSSAAIKSLLLESVSGSIVICSLHRKERLYIYISSLLEPKKLSKYVGVIFFLFCSLEI